ncbi:hypothetical protein DUI87_16202 [Hirundo rustica rustica]|uniref:Uncharacterized protein n=1 Tax=Hirundo rustica rustica TaxID=333673 RepID=A0A3M0K0U7_HIRRU|nr:hypothetical protein DUI87_16202 [Hirundo rustica rustica]
MTQKKGFSAPSGKLADDTKLSVAVVTPEGSETVQTDMDKLKKWAHGNLTETKCKVPHLAWGISQYQYRLGCKYIESSPAKMDFEVLVDERLNVTWQDVLGAHRDNCFLGSIITRRGQQVEGGDSAPVFCSCEILP